MHVSSDIYVCARGVLAAARLGDLMIGATGDLPIDDVSWAEWINWCVRSVKRDGFYPLMLQWAPKHGPSARQRSHMVSRGAELCLHQQKRAALISESTLVRGIITAMGWSSRAATELRAFAPRNVGAALTWLSDRGNIEKEAAERLLAQVIESLDVQAKRVR